MAVKLVVKYKKEGAVFANTAEAVASKDSKYSPELLEGAISCLAKMVADGIMLKPTTPSWDQSTYTLTLEREIVSFAEYQDAITFSIADTVAAAEEAGWMFVGSDVTSI